jgi:hypothetical protein
VFSICTSWFKNFTGHDSPQPDDDAYTSPPGREPSEYHAEPPRRPGAGGQHGSLL